MKYSLPLTAVALTISLFSTQANASLVDMGYTLDDGANIVTDESRGLQWLQWDASTGMSITEGLATFASDGWRLADNLQMADLMNDAGFGAVTSGTGVGGSFDSNENTSQRVNLGYSYGETSAANDFLMMFGDTFASAGYTCCGKTDPLQLSRAIFGDDVNGNGFYNSATVLDDFRFFGGPKINGYAALNADSPYFTATKQHSTYGLALVRTATVSPVPVPASLPLLALALISFGYIHKRRLKK